ncbi:MAG TPA: PAS domain S-box protein [Pseudorhizobium sp.]|nr:PAS domain S-box protein [Pseudorhizobium sp.]
MNHLVANEAFRVLADLAPVMIWIADPDGSCTFLSRSWCVFTGQTEGDGLGAGWASAIHPDDRESIRQSFWAARLEKRSYQAEYRVLAAGGAYRWVLDSAAPIVSSEGHLEGFVGSIVDNEERKQAELARDRSEDRLRLAVRAAGIGIWEWDLSSNTFEFSPEARAVLGLEESDTLVTVSEMQGVVHPDDIKEVQRLSAAALDPTQRSKAPYRYRIVRPSDGEVRWVLAMGEAIFTGGAQQSATKYIGTFQDIADEVRREEELREAASRLKLALDAAELAVWELDTTTGAVAPSPALNRLYEFPEDATPTAEDLRSRYAPGERERLQQLGREAAERGESHIRVEVKHILPSGVVRWLLIQAEAAPPIGKGGPRVIGVAMDITDRKLYEERLTTIAEELQHRVKNSLAVVQTLASQSFRANRSIDEGKRVFGERLVALASTTELLSRDGGTAAGVRDIIERAIAPFEETDRSRFELSGPDVVVLSARMAVNFGMALHELGTNAVKYGALSVPDGRVVVSWTVDASAVRVRWQEQGGPSVTAPEKPGFGTRLLKGALLNPAQGRIDLEFHPEGLICEIEMTLS